MRLEDADKSFFSQACAPHGQLAVSLCNLACPDSWAAHCSAEPDSFPVVPFNYHGAVLPRTVFFKHLSRFGSRYLRSHVKIRSFIRVFAIISGNSGF